MLFFPVFAKLQHRLDPSPPLPCSESISTTLIQTVYPQTLTDSPTQRHHHNSFGINTFRTLFTATGGVPPLAASSPSLRCHPSNSRQISPIPSITYKMQISQLLSFDIHANWWGGYTPRISRFKARRSDVSTFRRFDACSGPLHLPPAPGVLESEWKPHDT